jgi:hypothetical protein
MRIFVKRIGLIAFIAGNLSAAIGLQLNTTMTIPYPATASGAAVDLTVTYTQTASTTGSKLITATGSPYTESGTVTPPDAYSQVFDSPGPQILPGGSQTLNWSLFVAFGLEATGYEDGIDLLFAKEWVGSYQWSGIGESFVPLSFASLSSSGTTQLQLVNQLPSTDIGYSELSVFNSGSYLLTNGSGTILGGQSANVGSPFTLDADFALHVKDDNTGAIYDLSFPSDVPEPGSLALCGAPLLAALLWRRRRRQA